MKSTGIVRKIDDLGRIVIPIELRRSMGLALRDPLEIFTEGDAIVLKKHEASCIFCGGDADLRPFRDKAVCEACLRDLAVVSL